MAPHPATASRSISPLSTTNKGTTQSEAGGHGSGTNGRGPPPPSAAASGRSLGGVGAGEGALPRSSNASASVTSPVGTNAVQNGTAGFAHPQAQRLATGASHTTLASGMYR